MPDTDTLLTCPSCGAQVHKDAANTHAVNHKGGMPATYSVIIGGLIGQEMAETLADSFRHSPTKPDSVTISVQKVWWPNV